MTPANVYFVVWWFDSFGGMERHVTDIALALARRGVRVTVFSETPVAPTNRYAIALRAAGIGVIAPHRRAFAVATRLDHGPAAALVSRRARRVVPDNGAGTPPLSWPMRNLLAALAQHAAAAAPDVIHLHGCRLGQYPVLQWAASHGIASVYTEHVTISDWGGPFEAEAPAVVASMANAIACVSEASRTSLLDCLPQPREVDVVRHIIADPHPQAPPSWLPQRSPVSILAVGRLAAHKGHDTLLAAAALLRDQGVAVEVQIAGGGSAHAALAAQRARLGLSACVHLLGEVEAHAIPTLWRDAAIAVLPSHTEGLPLSVVEAMAAARPIVASRVGGIPELVTDGVNGLLVPPGDAATLAAALARVIRDPALAAKLATGARRSFETGGWSEAAVVDQTMALYAKARQRKTERHAVQTTTSNWATTRARHAAAPIKCVALFVWALASFGNMEQIVAQQAVALALAGIDVLLFVARPVPPFNRYVRAMRRAGVRIIVPTPWTAVGQRGRSLPPGRGGSTPLSRAFAAACAAARPAAVHIHGWRLSCGWLRPVLDIADQQRIALVYTEHAPDVEAAPLLAQRDTATIARFGALSAASAAAAAALRRAALRPVTLLRHAANVHPVQACPPCQVLAVDEIALLSATDADFDAALVEAMAAGKPVIVGDAGEALPIRHRANGLHVNGDPAAALRELLADPLLARQFAVAARRTYEREGLRDLGIVTEAVAIYRAAAPEAVAHAGG